MIVCDCDVPQLAVEYYYMIRLAERLLMMICHDDPEGRPAVIILGMVTSSQTGYIHIGSVFFCVPEAKQMTIWLRQYT